MGHVGKGADVFAEPPYSHTDEVKPPQGVGPSLLRSWTTHVVCLGTGRMTNGPGKQCLFTLNAIENSPLQGTGRRVVGVTPPVAPFLSVKPQH